jgi:diguanylate cyclase (GGDEF)-like protein/PAS domain S-box-containing protein
LKGAGSEQPTRPPLPAPIWTPLRVGLLLLLAVALANIVYFALLFLVPALGPWHERPLVHILSEALILAPVLFIAIDIMFRRYTAEHRRAVAELVESEQRFQDIAENANEWIWEVDSEGRYTYASPVVERILGYRSEEVMDKHFYDLFHPDDREAVKKAAFEAFAARQPFQNFVNRNIHKDGTSVWLSTSGIPVIGPAGELLGYRGADSVINDESSVTDRLTGLLNREGFMLLGEQQFRISVRNDLSLSVLFADMDNLKQINDRWGHLEGDNALVDVARILRRCVRGSDTLSRLGGDEFVVLLSGRAGTADAAHRVLQHITDDVNAFNCKGGRRYRLSISAAVAIYDPAQPESLEQLMARADQEMYAVKQHKPGSREQAGN